MFWRRLLKTALLSFSLTLVIIFAVWRQFNARTFSDGLFVVGLVMFFFALITLTQANNLFISTGYVFRNVFRRRINPVGSYHQYLQEKEVRNDVSVSLVRFFVSILFLTVSWYLVNGF